MSDRRLYLDKQGRVVEHTDPSKVTLLVAAGGTLLESEARRLGLLKEAEPTAKPKPQKTKAPATIEAE